MLKRGFYLLFALLFIQGTEPVEFKRFTDVDNFARKQRKSSSLEKTAENLVAPFSSDLEKVRAIFIWITDNVKYDVKRIQGTSGGGKRTRIFAKSEQELEKIKRQRERDKANIAFDKGIGVCENYSYLFKYMCLHVGIEADLVGGQGRNDPKKINRISKVSNHAWNRVKIDGNWYLLDATWAAGMTNLQKGKFHKKYQEGFFMTKPSFFITTHFPDESTWQLLEEPIDKEQFSKLPLGHHALAASGIVDFFPKTGAIKNSGQEIKLSLKVKNTDTNFVLLDNRNVTRIRPTILNNEVIFSIKSNRLRGHELTIAKKVGKETVPVISYKVI